MKKRKDTLIPIINQNDCLFSKKFEFELWSTQSSTDYRTDRKRPYNGQSQTLFGKRGKTKAKGLTMRDTVDCLIKAMILSSPPPREYFDRFLEFYDFSSGNKKPSATLIKEQDKFPHTKVEIGSWKYQDIYKLNWDEIDPLAICQNLVCEIEKMMGIYPNISKCPSSKQILDKLADQ